jgi:hypothetical protein
VGADAIAAHAWPEQAGATAAAAVADLIDELRRTIEPAPAAPHFLRSEPGGYRLMIA